MLTPVSKHWFQFKGVPTREKKGCERVYMVVSHKLHPKQMVSSNVQWWSYKQAIKTSELKRHILVNPEI